LETPEPDLTYTFKHVITQEVVYNLLPFAQRRELHHTVAEWYEHTQADLGPFYPLLAHHWGKAEVTAKTIDYLEKAGEQALERFANREAIAFFTQALAQQGERVAERGVKKRFLVFRQPISPGQLRRARWERQLGDAYQGLGEIPVALEHYRRAAQLLNKPEPLSTAGLILSSVWQLLIQILHRCWPNRFLGRSKEADEVLVEASRVYARFANCYYHVGPVYGALLGTVRSLNLAESAKSRSELTFELSRGYTGLGGATAGVLRIPAKAEPYFKDARETAERGGNLPALMYALYAQGLLKIVNGIWDGVEEPLNQALAIGERLGDLRERDLITSFLEYMTYNRGQFAACQKLAEGRYVSAHRREDVQFQISALGQQALALLTLGLPNQALPLLEQALSLLPEGGYLAETVLIRGIMALTYLRLGDQQRALQAVEAAAKIEKPPPVINALEGYTTLAVATLTLWEQAPGEAKRLTGLARQAIANLGTTARQTSYIHLPRVGLFQGLHDWLTGKHGKAQKTWRKGLTAAEKLGVPYDEGRLRYEIGRHLDPNDPARREHLTRAIEIFARLSAAYDLAQAQAALAEQS
ncbi:MAG: hypothetical protein HYR94_24705, partial [Chloroflexi bacterium]|nr:hypothetical protein [Chloroflexota bacterium]